MKTLCLNFQIHQPYRLKTYRFFDIAKNHNYYDEYTNKSIIRKVSENSYLPGNRTLLDMIERYGDFFKVSFSISGNALDQFQTYAPEVIDSFRQLAQTGQVAFTAETYAHSLASIKSPEEFVHQTEKYSQTIQELFGQKPNVFCNTEMIYDDQIGQMIAKMGFKALLTEGVSHVLGWRSPHFLYHHPQAENLKILLRNFNLSDDLAFRFSNQQWTEWPLTTEKYVKWLNGIPAQEKLVNIFLAYESFGEHHPEESGIFEFLRALPLTLQRDSDYIFITPDEATEYHDPSQALPVSNGISWSDVEKDLTAWLGNELQEEAFSKLYQLREKVANSEDQALLADWYHLQNSDHFYYMSTKVSSDGAVNSYFNPYGNPYDAFINYMNVLSDFSLRVEKQVQSPRLSNRKPKSKSAQSVTKKKTTTQENNTVKTTQKKALNG